MSAQNVNNLTDFKNDQLIDMILRSYLHVASEVSCGVPDLEVPRSAVRAGRALCRAVLQRRDLGGRRARHVGLAARVLVELAAVRGVH